MEVKTALIVFGACFIVGIVGFYIVTMVGITKYQYQSQAIVSSIVGTILVGFFGFFGTLIYWLFRRVKKWMLGY